jgi:hypothetical protein
VRPEGITLPGGRQKQVAFARGEAPCGTAALRVELNDPLG